ncbi:CoxG family protein [Neobacillus mesonae]|uniref:Carbon monoxide dehydrogenase n=1 Tax=Neobacillus mesonae TaxID=1193713 RepID=A0A3Q9QTP8_9BACI|nr:SRPBCC family protein [Neobacillus mesonae]AZU61305.1 carbon monoxide dehydrogenase [Neobacillus mesonae]
MPSGMHQIELDLPIEDIWNFVKDMDNWAPLVPNYIQHEKLTDRKSTWEFKSDIGILKKKISLIIDIKEWLEPTRVSFELKGKSEKYGGEGYFEAKPINLNRTKLTGFLEVNAIGKMAIAVNSKLETALPKAIEEMSLAICSKLGELKRVK